MSELSRTTLKHQKFSYELSSYYENQYFYGDYDGIFVLFKFIFVNSGNNMF